MIGHKGHPEVEGTMGQTDGGMYLVENAEDVAGLKVGAGGTADSAPKLAYVTQTTLSVDDASKIVAALKVRFPAIIGPKKDDICYATQNRQDAVKHLASKVDVVFVVGSKNSSNSNRLKEVADHLGVRAQLVDDATQIDVALMAGVKSVGVSAGASAPEILVNGVIEKLSELGSGRVITLEGVAENVIFPIPKELG
jgi:4-hydroxy-3-methylbut-2-enyl diphosphate reductase